MSADPDAVVAAVLAVPAVVRLDGGVAGEVATYLPGRRVHGVRLLDDRVVVHVAVDTSQDVRVTAEQVRDVVAPLVDGQVVDVVVADLVLPAGVLDDPADDDADHGVSTAAPPP